jgi:hypothetical protein
MSGSGAEVSREDLHATLAARRELGEEYEPALVDALAERVERVVEARVEARLGQRQVGPPAATQASAPQASAAPAAEVSASARIGVAMGSLALAIPLTGIAGGTAGVPGMAIAWGGIVAVNVAFAVGAGLRSRR